MAVYDGDEDDTPEERNYGNYVREEQSVIRGERRQAEKRARAAEGARCAAKLWAEIIESLRRAA